MLEFLKSNKFLKALIFIGLLGLIVLIFSQKTDLTASDLGRHLANGRIAFHNSDILFKNTYSYTEPDFRFINHHWFYGVIAYNLYRLGGFTSLSVLNLAIILLAFSLSFLIASRKISQAADKIFKRSKFEGFYFSSFLSLPVILLLSERVEIRPEIFSYLFIILTYWLLDSAVEKQAYRRLWLLMPLFAVWANIHIYFFIGLAFVGFQAAAVFIKQDSFRAAWINSRRWLIFFLASASACLLNPNTWRGLIYPFQIFKNYGYEIAENKSVFFLEHLAPDANFFIFKLILILLVASWTVYFICLKKEKKNFFLSFFTALRSRLFDILVTFLISGLALMSSRNISLFGLVSLIIICANIAPALICQRERSDSRLNIWQRWFNSPFERIHSYVLVIIGSLIIITFIYLINDERHDNNLIKNSFGWGLFSANDASAAFFKEHNLTGPIFNNYDIGSALIFWLNGREKVFVDNRPEAYSAAFFNDIYKPMQTDELKWEESLKNYAFRTIYFTHTDGTPWAQQFLDRILNDKKWRLVYFDAYTVILIDSEKYSPDEVNSLSLDKWAIKKRIRELSSAANLKSRLQLADLAIIVGLPEQAEEIYRESLFKYPEEKRVLYALAGLYASYNERESLIKSVDYYQRALAAGLRLPGVYNQLGLAYWNQGEYKKAESAWLSALKRERKNDHAVYYLKQIEELKRVGKLPPE